eukprot:CAMPEP_0175082298 /NCGR_PEP_ID=MMETSP0052_2-20121109/26670_1 /TAXON_ID=51329 ORGANISM="Polytomella parva, Strain SAG 63-3" /NCGR_SAMPLE_ID=MMETSP0052_2 /ASSEMBLY_ACC=CAM_ASM_000194 /LENGTH=39 /DNA_ID= /DNA_START= /DNA_END= /DNA_ORIENTATION=
MAADVIRGTDTERGVEALDAFCDAGVLFLPFVAIALLGE